MTIRKDTGFQTQHQAVLSYLFCTTLCILIVLLL